MIRRLPPSLTQEELEEQLQPLPEVDYLEFFSNDTRWSDKNTLRCLKRITAQSHVIIEPNVLLSTQPVPSPLREGLHQLQKPRGYCPLQGSVWWICVHRQQRYKVQTFTATRTWRISAWSHFVPKQVRNILQWWSLHLFKRLPRKEIRKGMQSVEQLLKVNLYTDIFNIIGTLMEKGISTIVH